MADATTYKGRAYLGVHYAGKVYRLSTFQLDKVFELAGGYLPPFIYQYHFNTQANGEVVPGKRWERYNNLEPVLHADGIALGAFSAEAVIDLSERAKTAAVERVKIMDKPDIMVWVECPHCKQALGFSSRHGIDSLMVGRASLANKAECGYCGRIVWDGVWLTRLSPPAASNKQAEMLRLWRSIDTATRRTYFNAMPARQWGGKPFHWWNSR